MNHRRRTLRLWVAVVLAAGGVAALALPMAGPRGASAAAAGAVASQPSPDVSAPANEAPLQISLASPKEGAAGTDGAEPVVFSTTGTVSLGGARPVVSPSVPGTWSSSPGVLTWTPVGALAPFTTVRFTFPAGLTASGDLPLGSSLTLGFSTGAGSVLRLQQLLAQLGYLPLRLISSTPVLTLPEAERAVFQPPSGSFAWTWPDVPAALAAAWAPGQVTAMTRGAIMAFEYDHHLGVDGLAGPQVWSALLRATTSPGSAANQHGYTFALATKTLPETLTVWHDGTVISRSGTNSGIAQAPTTDGTFPVYERLATQIMRGKNPDGTAYADPVAWVAYFNGADAIHYIARSSYGSPQSLGCLEVPYAVGQTVWPYLTIGSLVTVTG